MDEQFKEHNATGYESQHIMNFWESDSPNVIQLAQYPLEVPPFNIDCEPLKKTVQICVDQKYFTEHQHRWWLTFFDECKFLQSNMCVICKNFREKQESIAKKRIKQKDVTSDNDKAHNNKINSDIGQVKKDLANHIASNDKLHRQFRLPLIEKIYAHKIFNYRTDSEQDMSMPQVDHDDNVIDSRDRWCGNQINGRQLIYNRRTKLDYNGNKDPPVACGHIVVIEYSSLDWPGYPFGVGKVVQLLDGGQNVEVQHFMRIFANTPADQQQRLIWLGNIAIAHEMHYETARQAGDDLNDHWGDTVAKGYYWKGYRDLLRILSMKTKSMRNVKPKSSRLARKGKNKTFKNMDVDESDDGSGCDDDYVEHNPDRANVSCTRTPPNNHQIITDALNQRMHKQSKKNSFSRLDNFMHHFNDGIVPTSYVRARGCEYTNPDDAEQINQWCWGPDESNLKPSLLARSLIITSGPYKKMSARVNTGTFRLNLTQPQQQKIVANLNNTMIENQLVSTQVEPNGESLDPNMSTS
jgi:hypothetical protein